MVATIAAAAAVASAAAGTYGAVQSGNAQRQSNANNQRAFDFNARTQQQNQELDVARAFADAQQRALDNRRYDESVGREDKQRDFTNKLATSAQTDSLGNRLFFDPTTNTWRRQDSLEGRDELNRNSQQRSGAYNQSVLGQTQGGMQAADRLTQGGIGQSDARALGSELMARYKNNQGRTPQQMEAAGIERNVANVTDPLRTGGNMAMLQGYRQGNSGNDALMGALARQSNGGTRAAIADARYTAPTASADERGAASKALLSPATTLMERGATPVGNAAPTYEGGMGIDKLMASIQRNNPAGVGTSLNPRSAGIPIGRGAGNLQGFTPLNANGNEWAGVSQSLSSLAQPGSALMQYFKPNGTTYDTATRLPATPELTDALMRGGNFNSGGVTLS
jgi:hypothetical protein